MSLNRFARVALTLALAACGTSIHEMAINRAPHPMAPRPTETVELYVASAPQRPFVEVAFFSAQQESGFSLDDREAVLGKMRQRAGEVGCDAVIVTGPNDKVEGTFNRHGGSVQTLQGWNGACIVYR